MEAIRHQKCREGVRGGGSRRGSNQRNRERCARFRRLEENTRTIKLLDSFGNSEVIRQQGHLLLPKHRSVLEILSQRSRRWSKQPNQHASSVVAPTPTIGQIRHEEDTIWEMNGEILTVHGDPPGKKPEGVCCLVYENVNGISNRIKGWQEEKQR